MKLVQVLGPGCMRCTQLKTNAEAAVKDLEIEALVEKGRRHQCDRRFRSHGDPGLGDRWRGEIGRQSLLARRDQRVAASLRFEHGHEERLRRLLDFAFLSDAGRVDCSFA